MSNSTHLAQETCQACLPGAPALSDSDIAELKPQLPDWNLVHTDGVKKLTRSYVFPNYADALTFTNRVAAIAEDADHHPEITLEWGKVNVTWWTHTISGLHRNDAIMAAKTDALFATN